MHLLEHEARCVSAELRAHGLTQHLAGPADEREHLRHGVHYL